MPLPALHGGPARARAIRAGAALLALLLVGFLVWSWVSAESALDRTSLANLTDRTGGLVDGEANAADPALDEVLHVLVVGSDSRAGLSDEERRRLTTGGDAGEQTDTILLFQVRPDGVTVVSFPRDLKVRLGDDGPMKINAVMSRGGPDALVGVVERALEIDVDHYVEVAIPSFLDIVDAVGGVELCLDEPLRDRKSGADFEAGCQRMDGTEALAFVRSRDGRRSDFARVERQQQFLRALSEEATSLPVLADPLQLRALATEVARGLTVDDGLSIPRMIELARALRGPLQDGQLTSVTVPGSTATEDDDAFVIAYPPGVDELGRVLRAAQPLAEQLDAEERQDLDLGLWHADAPGEAATIESVLFYLGYVPEVQGPAPEGLDVERTTVFHVPGAEDEAEEVARVLGADVEPVPTGVELPERFQLAVVAAEREPTTVGGVLLPPAVSTSAP